MRAVTMVLALMVAGSVCASERREAGTMRVVSCAPAAAEALQKQLAGLDADVAIAAARRGSVIVSRHPVLDQREVELAPAAHPKDRCVAAVARIAQPGVPGGVYVVAACLTTAGSVSPADALALAGLVASLPGPVVVAGDLVPTAEKPLEDVLATTPGAGAHRLFTSAGMPAAGTFAKAGAAVVDLTVHPAIPALPLQRASL